MRAFRHPGWGAWPPFHSLPDAHAGLRPRARYARSMFLRGSGYHGSPPPTAGLARTGRTRVTGSTGPAALQRGPHARSSCRRWLRLQRSPDLHTVCRSFPKISSALSAKVCGGSRSAKKGRVPFHGLTFSAFLSCFQTDTKPYSRDQRLSEND
jgi:hypothetical protein